MTTSFCGIRRAALVGSLLATAATPLVTPAFAGSAARDVPASTTTLQVDSLDSSAARRLTVATGKSVIVDLPRDAAEIFVANPAVANAVVRSPRRLYVIGQAQGQTSVVAMDAAGRQIALIDLTVGRDIGELDRILKTAIPTSQIVLRTVNDTIILTGSVDSAGDAQQALDIATGFVSQANAAAPAASSGTAPSISISTAQAKDGKVINSLAIRGRDQVMLKVTIAEVQREVLKQLGVTSSSITGSWGTFQQDNRLPLNLQTLSSTGVQAIVGGGSNPLTAVLRAFERNGVAHVLAEPTVTAISGESAKFTAGGEVPIPQNETCGTTTTGGTTGCTIGVTYKPYGVTLNFSPVVLSAGRILLRVATEVTEIDPTQTLQFTTVNVPAFRTRKNETSVELPSGGSIMSAGLIQTRSRQIVNGLPGLMNLPVLGQLFRSRDYMREETELMIIVTPYIAKPVQENQLARPDDGFQDASDPQTALLGRVNRIYSTTSNPQVIKNFKGRIGFITD